MLANVAGIVQFGRFEGITEEEWDRVHAVDLKGPFFVIQAALPHLKAVKGNIVNVSSVAGQQSRSATPRRTPRRRAGSPSSPRPGPGALAGGHPRERGLSRHRGHADRVSTWPSIFPTDLDPRVVDRLMMMLPGRAISPAEIGSAIVYLASPAARMITGAVLAFDGGMS